MKSDAELPLNLRQFEESLAGESPPEGLPGWLTALWHAGKGNWERAHEIAQEERSAQGSWVHAYLHRVEGDPGNARFWYGRAGKEMPACSPEQEWRQIAAEFLSDLR